MSKLRKCAILRKISAHFELLAAMHLKRIGQGLVHHCVTSCPLLKTFCKHLGPEETNRWTFGRGTFSSSCLIEECSS